LDSLEWVVMDICGLPEAADIACAGIQQVLDFTYRHGHDNWGNFGRNTKSLQEAWVRANQSSIGEDATEALAATMKEYQKYHKAWNDSQRLGDYYARGKRADIAKAEELEKSFVSTIAKYWQSLELQPTADVSDSDHGQQEMAEAGSSQTTSLPGDLRKKALTVTNDPMLGIAGIRAVDKENTESYGMDDVRVTRQQKSEQQKSEHKESKHTESEHKESEHKELKQGKESNKVSGQQADDDDHGWKNEHGGFLGEVWVAWESDFFGSAQTMLRSQAISPESRAQE